eukprot:COSAG02_NODE_2745_length_8108_cov_2699.027469_3_plen_33_part_00
MSPLMQIYKDLINTNRCPRGEEGLEPGAAPSF